MNKITNAYRRINEVCNQLVGWKQFAAVGLPIVMLYSAFLLSFSKAVEHGERERGRRCITYIVNNRRDARTVVEQEKVSSDSSYALRLATIDSVLDQYSMGRNIDSIANRFAGRFHQEQFGQDKE